MSGVIGQTGREPLSNHLDSKASNKKEVHYRYQKVKQGFLAEVIGPFHSALYGTCAFGVKREGARKALKRRLGVDHGYFGGMKLSEKNDAENIGCVDSRVRKNWITGTPATKTTAELVGSAGQ